MSGEEPISASKPASMPAWQKALLALLWLLALIPVIHTVTLSERFTVPCPVADDWVLVGQYVSKLHETGSLNAKDWMEAYVHSRSPLPKMIGVALAEASHFNVKWMTRLTLLLTLGSLLAVLWLIVRTPVINVWEKALLGVVASFLIFSPYQQTQWLVGALFSNTMGITPVIVAIVLWSSRLNFWVKFALALAMALLATVSFIAGLVIWLFPPILLWVTRPTPSLKVRALACGAWLALMGSCLFLYFHGLEAGQSSIRLSEALVRWQEVTVFILSVIGSSVSFQPYVQAVVLGPALGAIYLVLLLLALGLHWRYFISPDGLHAALPWLGFIAFGVGNAALLALGRLDIVDAAFFTRYTAYTAFFFVGWLAILCLALRQGKLPSRLALVVPAVPLLIISIVAYIHSYSEGVYKSEFKHFATIQLRGAIEFVTALPDHEMLTTAAWDDPDRIILHGPFLAKIGMLPPGIVPSPYLRECSTVAPDAPENHFRGVTEKAEPTANGEVEVTGWAVGKQGQVPADLVVVTACPAADRSAERFVCIKMERQRRKDIVKMVKSNHLNGRYGWRLSIPADRIPPGDVCFKAYALDTDTLVFHQLDSEKVVSGR
jgi:hypothetical protein